MQFVPLPRTGAAILRAKPAKPHIKGAIEMKKGFKFYCIAWAIMFVLFNVAVAALPREFTVAGVT